MKTLLLTVLLLTGSALSDGKESPSTSNSTEIDLFGLIIKMSSSEVRSWAKPIENADMDRIIELIENDLVSCHKADWYAVVDDE